ncbi:PREDICTED: uncharacterized protein LOC106742704 [Dinoponera quadriceps]|uniref:Uncharacterized protein LOC106742704 n=1 Tax=Dinoponera quadriceps TaxID=609295 RepID=A0A6P3WZ50_DINQU|nr:PREDICTED: uncharacterized protein LOC106742704 [Dinoponera quadriceps]
MDMENEVFLFCGAKTSHHYNKFFHPNLCHVCKRRRLGAKLIKCDRCFLISYCSEEHRNLHLSQHHELCVAAEKFLKMNSGWFNRRLTMNEWLAAQNAFLLSVQQTIHRKCELYEEEMFLFARSCLICHKQTELYTCDSCFSADYCLDHLEEFIQHHKQVCDNLILWLNLEFTDKEIKSVMPLPWKFIRFPDKDKPFNDMVTFVMQYVKDETDGLNEWFAPDYICTDYVSGPLTLHHGMWEANLSHYLETESIYIIHVVAANSTDKNGLPAWEILLHLLPKIKVLIIVMIGPELQMEFGMHNICPGCNINGKKLIYECCPMLYHDYVSNVMYRKPNIIVGFQATLKCGSSWPKSIQAMQTQNCPLLLTAYTLIAAKEEIDTVQQVLGTKPVLFVTNKFKALRPIRSFNSVIYRNAYLIIYKKLYEFNHT